MNGHKRLMMRRIDLMELTFKVKVCICKVSECEANMQILKTKFLSTPFVF